ncbi:MAG TPA: type II secretion system F family protein, partial [Phycisphaerae bacterium]|nr:type II secretion system F family protein [Phycisphaerae bacterium]
MATYQYIARTPGGEETRGIMQADSEAVVLRSLDERALFPVRVVERRAKREGLRANIRMRDVATTYAQLADLLNAGVPLLRALDTLIRAVPHRQLVQVITRVRDAVSEGKALAEAMADHPRVFPPLHAAMIRAGERGGFLEDVLTNLSEYLDRVDDLRSRVRGALIYPMVLTVLGMGALLVVLLWLVPQFRTVFENVPLPAPTRLLFAVSDLLLHQWALLLGGLLLAVMGIVGLLRSDVGARWWDRWRLKIPLAGNLVRTVAITRFCRILGTLLHNGVAILQSLAISKDAAGSTVLAESIEKATESV